MPSVPAVQSLTQPAFQTLLYLPEVQTVTLPAVQTMPNIPAVSTPPYLSAVQTLPTCSSGPAASSRDSARPPFFSFKSVPQLLTRTSA
ncbi:hypothetical protein DPMN_105703 [Dreissena polymorpha]|uniref:Uncharacterized protein n=1 Tax=Dreissena polymorpha TaxID=45954 RepID=A0A9D4K3M9_DREPO|nr:hypothetical protein DPMN_105703 [Dreissena polymorpha]